MRGGGMRLKTYFDTEKVLMFIEKNHMTQANLSKQLEIGAPYLSLMISKRRPVSPKVRKRFIKLVEEIENREVNFDDFFFTHKYHKCDNYRYTGTE